MAYRVLARKYRPQTFEDMIGQAHIATTLTNALKSGKIAHAYLFSGPRGVGKTTAARILAKALNCAKGPTAVPCNSCDSCERIAQGQEMIDVLEIDAASNRGIEEIRELRENVRYAPARSRYKVYIVDEAHQITHDAFNAFLKTLEEPPEHAVFILATTEHQKIPATILSRCQLFRFKRVSVEDIAARLEWILTQEKIKVEQTGVLRLARAAGGAVRDALSLLDQALAYTTDTLTLAQIEMLLGFLPEEFLQEFAQALVSREPTQVLQKIKRLTEDGWELPQFVRDFREYARQTVVDQLSAGTSPAALSFGGQTVSLAQLLQVIKMMGVCLDEMRWNENPRLVLELYGLRLTQPFVDAGALIQRLDSLEAGSPSQKVFAPEIRHPGPSSVQSKPLDPSLRSAGMIAPKAPVSEAPRTPPSGDAVTQWKQFITELWKKPGVASLMERARLKSATASEWVVAFNEKFAMDSAQRSQAFLQEVLQKITGNRVSIRCIQEAQSAPEESSGVGVRPRDASVVEEAPVPAAASQPTAVPQGDPSQDARIQKILTTFKGRVRSAESDENT